MRKYVEKNFLSLFKFAFVFLIVSSFIFSPTDALAGNPSALTESLASEQAFAYLKGLYGDVSNIQETDIKYEEFRDIQRTFYIVTFEDSNNSCYEVELCAETGKLEYIVLDKQGIDFHEESKSLDLDNWDELYKKAKDIFVQTTGGDEEIRSSTCEYNITDDSTIPHGNINFFFELNNGDAIRVLYNVNNDVFWNWTYLSCYQSYRNRIDVNKSYRKDIGIERKVIDMTVK